MGGGEGRALEAAGHKRRQGFRQLAENIQEVFWMTDPAKNQMIYISPGYEKIWGRSCAELYESPKLWLEAIHPEDRERIKTAIVTKQAFVEEHCRFSELSGGVVGLGCTRVDACRRRAHWQARWCLPGEHRREYGG